MSEAYYQVTSTRLFSDKEKVYESGTIGPGETVFIGAYLPGEKKSLASIEHFPGEHGLVEIQSRWNRRLVAPSESITLSIGTKWNLEVTHESESL